MKKTKSKLSIVIPVFNEIKTLPIILTKINEADIGKIEKEIILIDDFSKDGSRELIGSMSDKKIIKIFHNENKGKGAAVKSGINASTGDIILVQDADLEYDPQDYKKLISPLLENKSQVVYGSRTINRDYTYAHFYFFLGGRIVTFFTNLLFFSKLTDEPTGYKTFKSEVIKNIRIKGDRFDWEPEVTAKILKKGVKIREVPISYYPRNISEGKKIRLKDGIHAILTLIKYRFND